MSADAVMFGQLVRDLVLVVDDMPILRAYPSPRRETTSAARSAKSS